MIGLIYSNDKRMTHLDSAVRAEMDPSNFAERSTLDIWSHD